MRVLFWMGENYQRVPGGHLVQAENTARALQALGVDVLSTADPAPDLANIDIVHGMSISLEQMRAARSRRIPIALSTIYWSTDCNAIGPFLGRINRLTHVAERTSRLLVSGARRGLFSTAQAVVQNSTQLGMLMEAADLLLPNSQLEARAIRDDLAVSTPSAVVPNAADHAIFRPDPDRARSGILYVGRIEPHKNQLALVRAARHMQTAVTLVGAVHPDHREYANRCRREAPDHVAFLGPRSQADLVPLYQQADVHVCPSFFETTGLVSLEAALSGCRVVSTNRGFASEYLGDRAEYCDPHSPRSIARAIARAHARDAKLRDHVLGNFTWQHAAEATLAAYRTPLA